MITDMDQQIGSLLRNLKALRIEEDTLVVFLSDNGPEEAAGYECILVDPLLIHTLTTPLSALLHPAQLRDFAVEKGVAPSRTCFIFIHAIVFRTPLHQVYIRGRHQGSSHIPVERNHSDGQVDIIQSSGIGVSQKTRCYLSNLVGKFLCLLRRPICSPLSSRPPAFRLPRTLRSMACRSSQVRVW